MAAPVCAFNLMINFRTMKRRGVVKAIAIAPSTGPLLAQTQTNQQPATQKPPAPSRGPVVGQVPPEGQEAPVLKTTISEQAATPEPSFFTADQIAALKRLSDLFFPSMNGNDGAVEAGTPEFLDFYTSVSAAEGQQLYRNGLDNLNGQARTKFKRSFSNLSNAEADQIVKSLFEPRGPLEAFPELGPFANRALQDIPLRQPGRAYTSLVPAAWAISRKPAC
jgi:hypothetical protein